MRITPEERLELDAADARIAAAEAAATKAKAMRPIIGTLPDGQKVRLRLHSDVNTIPGYEGDATFGALIASIANSGIIDPLVVHLGTKTDKETGLLMADIVNGRHRFLAARILIDEGKDVEIPVTATQLPAAQVIIDTLLSRRHATPGILAYLCWPHLSDLIARRRGKSHGATLDSPVKSHGATLETGNDEDGDPYFEPLRAICPRFGFSYDTLNRARKIHLRFAERPDLRAEYEPRILSGGIELSHVLPAIGGKVTPQARHRESTPGQKPYELIKRTVKDWGNRLTPDRWNEIELPKRKELEVVLVDGVLAWPTEILKRLREALRTEGA